ncbi:hypothetical protein BPSOL_1730 [Bifidobacterium pseudolongum]|nr:hypothetical protein BPSOL_1730 [Bifidobacterium pseudolongum]
MLAARPLGRSFLANHASNSFSTPRQKRRHPRTQWRRLCI